MKLVFNENDKIHWYYIREYFKIDYERIMAEEKEKTLLQNLINVAKKNFGLESIINIVDRFRNDKNNFKTYYDRLKEVIIGRNAKDKDLLEDIELFEETYQHYTYDRKPEERDLGDFLNYISLSPGKDLRNKGVALLTCHAAKGLEFDYVFLISLNQGIFPDYRAKEGSRALEEERRNCFVAITRTKEKLFISYTKCKDTRYGLRHHEPSRFLKEMGLLN